MLQLPVATLALQLWVPSLTVTLPVGVPLPGAFGATVNVKLTAWPTAEGFGVWAVIVVGGLPASPVCPTPAAVRVARSPSRGCSPATFCPPAEPNAILQVP